MCRAESPADLSAGPGPRTDAPDHLRGLVGPGNPLGA